MTDPRHGGAPTPSNAGAAEGVLPGQHDRSARHRQTGRAERRRYARSAGRALDLLLSDHRPAPDPRPACRAAMAHLKDCALWSELSRDVLVALVDDWQAGR